jgi:hypothetical protein
VGGCKISMLFASFGDKDFAFFLGQFRVYFFLADWADAFCLGQNNPPSVVDNASRMRAIGSKIMDMVIRRSYFFTFWIVGVEVRSLTEA